MATLTDPSPHSQCLGMNLDQEINKCLRLVEQPTQTESACETMIQQLLELTKSPVQDTFLGPYQLLDPIGAGGMGEVWKARHVRLNRTFAVKRLRPQTSFNAEARHRFEREMEIAGNLEHPNIVRIHHADEVDGVHFLAMDFIEGTTLSEQQKQLEEQGLKFDVEDVCRYGVEVASAMQHAHSKGVIHRDIKPSNLMLTDDGDVRVLDLGLARLKKVGAEISELTVEHQVMGTLDYMSPEQIQNSHLADERSDIYSLGVTLFRLLAGQTPFAGKDNASPEARIVSIASETPAVLSSIRTDVPRLLSNLVSDMLLKDPKQRPQTMQAVADRLEQAKRSKVASTHGLSSFKNRGIRWSMVAIAIMSSAFAVAKLTKMTFTDPVYGRLTVTAPENIEVRVKRVETPTDSYDFIANQAGIQLRTGRWNIVIPGEFNEYRVKNGGSFTISDGSDTKIEIVTVRPDPPKTDKRLPPTLAAWVKALGGKVAVGRRGAPEIDLRGTTVTSDDLQFLRSHPLLSSLHLDRTKVTSDGLKHVGQVASLTLSSTAVGDEVFEQLSRFRLKALDLSHTEVSDAGLAELVGQEGLTDLAMDACDRITGASANTLRQLPALRVLSVCSTSFDDAAVQKLSQLSLHSLYVASCPITDAALQSIARIHSLDTISLNSCQRISSLAIEQLAANKNLRQLLLYRVPISSKALLRLAEHPHLEHVHLERKRGPDVASGRAGFFLVEE
ncbi:MAG: protein kinase [Planctomycetaceae bacterium]